MNTKSTTIAALLLAALSQGAGAAVAHDTAVAVHIDARRALQAVQQQACDDAKQNMKAVFPAEPTEAERQFGIDEFPVYAATPRAGSEAVTALR